jgi:hypothetical protein
MTSFLTYLATTAIHLATEQSILGKPYVRIGKLFHIVGHYVYEEGGVLGYVLRDYPDLLVKLIEPPDTYLTTKQVIGVLLDLRERISTELNNSKEEETFFNFYDIKELRNMGIDFNSYPPDKNLYKQVDFDFAQTVMRTSFINGVALGFNFPKQFSIYWDNTYKIPPDAEWQNARDHGLILPEKPPQRTLNQAIVEMAEGAIEYSTNQTQNILDASDIKILEAAIEYYKKA